MLSVLPCHLACLVLLVLYVLSVPCSRSAFAPLITFYCFDCLACVLNNIGHFEGGLNDAYLAGVFEMKRCKGSISVLFSRVCSIIIYSSKGRKANRPLPGMRSLFPHLTHKYAPPPRFLFFNSHPQQLVLSFPFLLVLLLPFNPVTHTLQYFIFFVS